MQGRLGALGLGYVSLESAAAAAGLRALVESGLVSRDETVVLFDTGAGFKSEAVTLPSLPRIPNDEAVWRQKMLPGLRPPGGGSKRSTARRSG